MRRIANYVVDDNPLARGGMGQIFRGQDAQGNIVAIKEILPEFATDWGIRTRIEKEVEFLMKCDHPSIVKLHLAFYDESTQNYYIIMEMVDGLNIEQYVMRNGPIPESEAVEMMMKILDALQCVHNAHIIHRDIKPSNIMIRPNGNICLLDFGVAKDMENGGGGTIAGSVIGTDGYMSPEQADGYSVNYNTDIYSLGCVLYYMLTGHHAFNTLSSEFETKDAILNTEFPRLSKYNKNASDAIQRILDKATDKNMIKRYQNCYEFMGALNSGTHISHTSSHNAAVMISIGREKCDIIVEDSERKISRHHADVELKVMTGLKCYVFTDCSANGTVVNGKVLRKSSVNIPVGDPIPEIYLAGVLDGKLDWKKVVTELNNRLRAIQNVEEAEVSSAQKVDPDSLSTEQKPVDNEFSSNTKNEGSTKYVPEEAPITLVLAYIFAFLGGWLGIVLGLYVSRTKTKLANGEKVYKYKDSHRQLGLVAAIVSVLAAIVWIFVQI